MAIHLWFTFLNHDYGFKPKKQISSIIKESIAEKYYGSDPFKRSPLTRIP
jgi:hypothetical protein